MVSTELTAKEFFKKFTSHLYNAKELYNGSPYYEIYANSTKYTNLINHDIVRKILEENGMDTSNEYYRVDVTGWIQVANKELQEKFALSELNWHSWQLKVAFEHENNYKDWCDEVIKLLYIDCSLRIVVGYNQAQYREDEQFGDSAKLGMVANVIKNLDKKIEGELMVILGNCGKGYNLGKGLENYYGYRAYLFNTTTMSFESINQ